MTDQGSKDLTKVLTDCAIFLRWALIDKTGSDTIEAVSMPKRLWRAPALRPNLTLNGINLNDLPRHLYGDELVTPEQFSGSWLRCVGEMLDSRYSKSHSELFPSLPFTQKPAPPTAMLTQLLCAGWWSGGTFTVSGKQAWLRVAGKNYGFDERVVMNHPYQTRLPRGCIISPNAYLTCSLGAEVEASHALGSLYEYLLQCFPHLSRELAAIFATAVDAGKPFQDILLNAFDVTLHQGIDPASGSDWDRARFLINTSITNPRAELWKILEPWVSHVTFAKVFGNPKTVTRTFSEETRAAFRSNLDLCEAGEAELAVAKPVKVKVDEEDQQREAAARNLLRLQQMIGL